MAATHNIERITMRKSRKAFASLLPLFAFLFGESQLTGQEIGSVNYPNPGIVAQRGGKWVGSDHLYNISNKIGINVEIFKPQNTTVPVSSESIKERVVSIFLKGKIEPKAESLGGKPSLPFFHVLLMVYPIDKGFVVFCEGRLFEEVHIDRVILDQQTVMQAITWESQNMIIASEADLDDQINKSIDEIANTFVDRFIFYSNIKTEIKK